MIAIVAGAIGLAVGLATGLLVESVTGLQDFESLVIEVEQKAGRHRAALAAALLAGAGRLP